MTDAPPNWITTLAAAEGQLPAPTFAMRYADMFRHGSMRLGLYAPRGVDEQGPHKQDELYVIASGWGRFHKGTADAAEVREFGPHDVIFVEAGVPHHFSDFTPDFEAWVIFWGPDGGER